MEKMSIYIFYIGLLQPKEDGKRYDHFNVNPNRLGGSKFTYSAWGGGQFDPLLKSSSRVKKSGGLVLDIDTLSLRNILSHHTPRSDLFWEIR